MKRLHPERIVFNLGLVLLVATWTLGLMGFLTSDRRYWLGATYTLAATIAVASTPLLAFLAFTLFEKVSGNRRSQSDDRPD